MIAALALAAARWVGPLAARAAAALPALPTLVPLGLGALAVAAALLWLRLDVLGDRAARLDAERLRLEAALAEQDRAIAERDAALAAVAAEAAAAEARAGRLAAARQEILDAPETDDGPAAAVLRGALERLRRADP